MEPGQFQGRGARGNPVAGSLPPEGIKAGTTCPANAPSRCPRASMEARVNAFALGSTLALARRRATSVTRDCTFVASRSASRVTRTVTVTSDARRGRVPPPGRGAAIGTPVAGEGVKACWVSSLPDPEACAPGSRSQGVLLSMSRCLGPCGLRSPRMVTPVSTRSLRQGHQSSYGLARHRSPRRQSARSSVDSVRIGTLRTPFNPVICAVTSVARKAASTWRRGSCGVPSADVARRVRCTTSSAPPAIGDSLPTSSGARAGSTGPVRAAPTWDL